MLIIRRRANIFLEIEPYENPYENSTQYYPIKYPPSKTLYDAGCTW